MPVEQINHVAFTPVPQSGDGQHFFLALFCREHSVASYALFRMPADMTVAAVLGVDKPLELLSRGFNRRFIVFVAERCRVPTHPNRRRVHVDKVCSFTKATGSGFARRVEAVSNRVQLRQHGAQGVHIVAAGKIRKPVKFIAQRPNDDTRAIEVLMDHFFEKATRIVLPLFAPHTAPAPR